jgi:hypothetical protein
MLFSEAFPVSEDELNGEDPDVILERKRFLEEFPNYELLAVHSVALFLAELVGWVYRVSTRCSSLRFVAIVTI